MVLFRIGGFYGLAVNAKTFSENVEGLISLPVPLHWVAVTMQQWNLMVERQLKGIGGRSRRAIGVSPHPGRLNQSRAGP